MTVLRMGYFGVGVSDIAAWRSYASDVLGVEVADGPDGSLRLRVDSRDWRIAVEPTGEDDIIYAGWEVAGASALSALISRFEAAGVPIAEDAGLAKMRGVLGLARFTDPCGVVGELFWGATERFEKPITSAVGTTGFMTGDQGLGHLVFSTKDPESMERFYRDLLGFSLSDYIDDPRMGADRIAKVTFMHCNPRHHSLAFAAVPAPKKLLHFMLQTNTLDDVGFALDRVHAAKIKLSLSLGRHVNDHMVSFYAFTPSGFEVEYGWGARNVEAESWTPVRHDRISVWGHDTINPPGTGWKY